MAHHRNRRFFSSSALALVALPAVLGACAGGDGPPDAPVARFAVIALSWPGGDAPDGLAAGYVFDHPAGQRARVLASLGLSWATLIDANVGVDQCVLLHDDANVADAPAQLIDAGDVTIETAEGETALEATYLPEDWPPATGLAYAGVLPMGANGQAAGQPITVLANGNDAVGRFAMVVPSPAPVRLLGVAGTAAGLAVQWSPRDARVAGEGSEQTVVTYERRGFGDAWTIACAVDDDGVFVMPAELLGRLPSLGQGPEDRTDHVVVRRIASASFTARGVPEGVVLAVSEDATLVGE